ncbi:MAG: GyrI-like domain-containing protein [Spirochaetales bacterium]
MQYRFVDKQAFEAVGWALRVSTVGGENFRVIPEFWNQNHAQGRVAVLAQGCSPLGVLGLCAEADLAKQEFTYFIAVEQQVGVTYPEGTRSVRLGAAKYVVFTAIGAMPDAIQNVWKQAFEEWFPASGYEHAGTPDFEVYPPFPEGDPRGNPDSPENLSEVWIPIRPKA